MPGVRLPTLRTEELFAYLCVHGASSAWFRLKWLTDTAAFLHGRSSEDIEHLYTRSQALGAGRAAGQALLLADAIYGSLANVGPLAERLMRDRGTRWLFQAAHRQLAGRKVPVEPTARPWGTAIIHLTQLLLQPGVSFPVSEFARQCRAALR